MIQGTARIARIAAVAIAAAMAITICTAGEPIEPLRFRHPDLALHLAAVHPTQAALTTNTPVNMSSRAIRQRSFYEGYLLPGLEKQLSRIGVLHTWILDQPEFGHTYNQDELAAVSERMFEKGASRALRSYLSEITGLETMVLNLAGRNDQKPESGEAEASRFNLGIGISSAMPRLDLGYRIGSLGKLRLSICADGAIDLNYGRYSRLTATRFYAGYDTKEGTGDAGLRISF